MLRNLAAAVLIGASAQPALAQDSSYDVLHASYSLWGMMDAAANFCWERSGYEVAYMEAHQNWLARNLFVRDELDAARAAAGVDPAVASAGEQAGSSGILDLLSRATNPDESCQSWLDSASGRTSTFEAETFLAEQLGILRERDGL